MDKELEKAYYTPAQPGSYGGVSALKRATGNSYTSKEIKEWLKGEDTYTLHKPIRHHFRRRRIIVHGIDAQWEADLVDLSKIAKHNHSYRYLLTVIDTLSKFAWAIPLKTKTGVELVSAFSQIISKSQRKPSALRSDKGSEFLNAKFQTYLKKNGIHFFTSNNEVKAAIIERFNRTLKTKMWKFFTKNNTLSYIPVLSDLMASYNNSWHRSIKRPPSTVNENNEAEVWHTLYGNYRQLSKSDKFKFDIGDKVRIGKNKMIFEKGYLPNWTTEIFTVFKRQRGNPPLYVLKDEAGERIQGTFYAEELQKVTVTADKLYTIERIIAERGKGKRKMFLVKWEGYPSKFNTWISASQLEHL